ncbi:transposase [Rhodococcus sp. 14-2483-1-2]|uniref:transposase n=1 Tax=Rhodococcus sp. 14-2483-1-2 TaxID=2023147 RepID=UPI00113FCCFB
MGPNGLLKQLAKNVLETALEAEMAGHLGYGKHDVAGRGNSRNSTRSKTVAHRDRAGRDRRSTRYRVLVRAVDSQEAATTPDGYRRDRMSLAARGLTIDEVSGHFHDLYGATVAHPTVEAFNRLEGARFTTLVPRRGRFLPSRIRQDT